jgi:threonine aldolase
MIELRSDTQTKPSPEMRAAIAAAGSGTIEAQEPSPG